MINCVCWWIKHSEMSANVLHIIRWSDKQWMCVQSCATCTNHILVTCIFLYCMPESALLVETGIMGQRKLITQPSVSVLGICSQINFLCLVGFPSVFIYYLDKWLENFVSVRC